ncbi:MSMEG_0569 family flavin-dependent oxidoreductase [Paraburkholderia silvatlantica]|uniref:Flavoprotein involved in K+ transport n=1 Tax=Paraburkholderia silvatlantica TaxID=321895 RepID=A0ABR6FXC3_9BURK|nr:MSMEG_0569 family flavin-dependent oxidoreductase [Paraburkholderia silvatlantica]MBB2931425.1 putative flavoprotein involved in K+ transport [Paraburkholderia silvatlantica]PVY27908.1 putative flavoprotein involved in K+ transport [Paraburkholderia silvatlantica]PXW34755.1 putative flavoprotein involved in K+ transport [Paraburkholderia silvatlantica]TDQ98621.1 putative flavoprotein involved in K+ transport [Paraburkholderia silvatlantica]
MSTQTLAANLPVPEEHFSVAVVGGGQAGLSMSYYLKQRGIDHVVLEKRTVTHTWREQRWDAFSLVTPNWQCALPGYPYRGDEPHGFMKKDEIIAWLDGFIRHVDAPVREGVAVTRVSKRPNGGFLVLTSQGSLSADQVVIASGGYHTPIVPRMAERLPASIVQMQSSEYRNPAALPEGAVLVVGSGQSGAQIAEDLHLAGRKVVLAVGEAPRCARFYRGRDVVDWLADMKYYDMPVEAHPLREGVRDNTNHYVTGRDGGRDIDLRKFASEGMELYGVLEDFADGALRFKGNLRANLDSADETYNRINASIDRFIAQNGIDAPPGEPYRPVWTPQQERTSLDLAASGIGSIVWCIGFQPDFSWIDLPVFNGRGYPGHARGVTAQKGLYFLGLPWLHTWGSGRFSGIARDAAWLADQISAPARLDARAA